MARCLHSEVDQRLRSRPSIAGGGEAGACYCCFGGISVPVFFPSQKQHSLLFYRSFETDTLREALGPALGNAKFTVLSQCYNVIHTPFSPRDRTRGPPAGQTFDPRGPPLGAMLLDTRSTYAAASSGSPTTGFSLNGDTISSACSSRI